MNDGICDYELCCDGSDEWAHVGGAKCEDHCKSMGKEWRRREEKRQGSLANAMRARKDLLDEAENKQKGIENEIVDLKAERKGQEVRVGQFEKELEDALREDQARRDRRGELDRLIKNTKERVDGLRTALMRVRQQRDDARTQAKELMDVFSQINSGQKTDGDDGGGEGNHQEIISNAVRKYAEYIAKQPADDAQERDLDSISVADSKDSGIDWDLWEGDHVCGNKRDYRNSTGECVLTFFFFFFFFFRLSFLLTFFTAANLIEYLPSRVASLVRRLVGIKKDDESTSSSETEQEPQTVIDAREALKSAQDSLRDIEDKIRDRQEDLEQDLGPGGIFRALRDSCFKMDAGEYEYEHCFLDRTSQISKKNGPTVSLGAFQKVGEVHVDEVDESTGHIAKTPRTTLEYGHGQKCWNGPQRSMTVVLECGEKEEIVQVREDEMCVYSMVAKTPAVCPAEADREGNDGGKEEEGKDEL